MMMMVMRIHVVCQTRIYLVVMFVFVLVMNGRGILMPNGRAEETQREMWCLIDERGTKFADASPLPEKRGGTE